YRHVFAHSLFVVTDFDIHCQDGQAPLVLNAAIQVDAVIVVGQHLAKGHHTDGPWTRFCQTIFQAGANAQLSDVAIPARATGITLVTKTTQVITLVITDIAEAWNVETSG